MGEYTTDNKAKLKPGLADQPPKAPAPKKPIRNLRAGQLKPLERARTEVTFDVGAFEGVPANATAELIGLATFTIDDIGPHRCSGIVDVRYEDVRAWHMNGGRAIVGK